MATVYMNGLRYQYGDEAVVTVPRQLVPFMPISHSQNQHTLTLPHRRAHLQLFKATKVDKTEVKMNELHECCTCHSVVRLWQPVFPGGLPREMPSVNSMDLELLTSASQWTDIVKGRQEVVS